MVSRGAGQPLKNVALSFGPHQARGEAMISARGIEGGVVYALSSYIRDAIAEAGPATVQIDLRPDVPTARLSARIAAARRAMSMAGVLRTAGGLTPVGIALVREASPDVPSEADALAALVKAVPLRLHAPMDIARAISSAGGIALDEVDEAWMLRRVPGTYVAGEMLDWEAPTGGYLLQATFATAVAAARGMLSRLDVPPPGRR